MKTNTTLKYKLALMTLGLVLNGCVLKAGISDLGGLAPASESPIEEIVEESLFTDLGWQEKASQIQSTSFDGEWKTDKDFKSFDVDIFEDAICSKKILTLNNLESTARKFSFTAASNGKTYSFRVKGKKESDTYITVCSGGVSVDLAVECQGNRLSNSPFANSGEAGIDGSLAKPFIICTKAQFAALAASTSDWDKNFLQGNDIDLTGYSSTIGTAATPFSGTYDGQSFSLSNFVITSFGTNNVGLFGYTASGSVLKNFKMTGVSIRAATRNNVGAVSGTSLGNIENVTVSGSVAGDGNVGGMVGNKNGGSITDSKVENISVATTCGSCSTWGGVVGESTGATLTRVSATGTVVGGFTRTGGLVGRYNGTITDSFANVKVTASYSVGGLIGEFPGGTVTKSYASGAVYANGGGAGGFVGRSTGGVIRRSYYNGPKVEALGNDAGGFVGSTFVGTIEDCYTTAGQVLAINNAGGFAGSTGWITFRNNFAAVPNIMAHVARQGGFVGSDNDGSGNFRSTYIKNYWDTTSAMAQSAGDNSNANANIQGFNTADMKLAATYSGWSSVTWDLVNGFYPVLK